MFPRSQKRRLATYLPLLMLAVLSMRWQCSSAYKLRFSTINGHTLNPNIRCPGKNEGNSWRDCKYGGFIENPDPKNCAHRYVCYVAVNEPCHHGDKCRDDAFCTSCDICQKCESPAYCSEFALCPNTYGTFNYFNHFFRRSFTHLEADLKFFTK